MRGISTRRNLLKLAVWLLVVLTITATVGNAQIAYSNKPLVAQDMFGTMRETVLIDSDAEHAMYTPDVTNSTWIVTYAQTYPQSKQFCFRMYTFNKETERTTASNVCVDRNKNVVNFVDLTSSTTVFSVPINKNPRTKAMINRVINLIGHNILAYNCDPFYDTVNPIFTSERCVELARHRMDTTPVK